jgi:hypothetical protein
MGDVANYEAARDDLNANIFTFKKGDEPTDLHRSLERLITAIPAAAEAAAQLPAPARPRVQPRPPASDEDLLWAMPRTVNGTGHTGPSEFCATSI